MENEVRKYRKYDREFIVEAVKMVLEGGRKVPEVARNLGINENVLYRWKSKYLNDPDNAFPGKGHLKPDDEKMKRLEKELYRVTRERDILKKAVAIFSKDPKTNTDL
jgi:transposase